MLCCMYNILTLSAQSYSSTCTCILVFAVHFIFLYQERDGINSPLDFSVVGGWELRQPIFVSEIVPSSIPAQEGLKVGDQVSNKPV